MDFHRTRIFAPCADSNWMTHPPVSASCGRTSSTNADRGELSPAVPLRSAVPSASFNPVAAAAPFGILRIVFANSTADCQNDSGNLARPFCTTAPLIELLLQMEDSFWDFRGTSDRHSQSPLGDCLTLSMPPPGRHAPLPEGHNRSGTSAGRSNPSAISLDPESWCPRPTAKSRSQTRERWAQ